MPKCLYNPEVKDAISYAREEALNSGTLEIMPIHLLLGIKRLENNITATILKNYKFNPDIVRKNILKGEKINTDEKIPVTQSSEFILKNSAFETFLHQSNIIYPIHVLLTILRYKNKEDKGYQYLKELNMDYDTIQEEFLKYPFSERGKYRQKLSKLFFNKILTELNFSKFLAWV